MKPSFYRQQRGPTMADIRHLNKLQQLFHGRFLTEELLNQLITIYVKMVQLSSDLTPLRAYFLQRISLVLSRPQIINILQKQQPQQDIRQTIKQCGIFNQVSPTISNDNESLILDKQMSTSQMQHGKQRHKKIQHQMRMMRQVQSNMKILSKEVRQADAKIEQKEVIVTGIYALHDQKLNERRAMRKNKNKKLRKKSAENVDQDEEDIVVDKKIIKEELMNAQKELTENVQRFTRMTTMKAQLEMIGGGKGKQKGKVNMNLVVEYEDEEEGRGLGQVVEKEEKVTPKKQINQRLVQENGKDDTPKREIEQSKKKMTELSIKEAHERLSRVNELLGQQAHKERVTVVQLESYDEDDIVQNEIPQTTGTQAVLQPTTVAEAQLDPQVNLNQSQTKQSASQPQQPQRIYEQIIDEQVF